MGKLVLWIVLGIAVYLMLRQAQRVGGKRKSRPKPSSPAVEVMVSCAHCGLHVPASESIESGGRYYCSEEHRRLGATRAGG